MKLIKNNKTVFVGMSGGVDSSVAAGLLKKDGYDVVGVHLRSYNVDGCGEQDAEDARRAAEALKIPFYVFDVEKEYRKKVVEYMVQGYKTGITPNPDVMCNKEIKFGVFLDKARAMGADYIATGHYVRLSDAKKSRTHANDANGPSRNSHGFALSSRRLSIAHDTNKDQSYFLWTLTQAQLKHCLFPIGDYLKSEVRTMARKFGLPNAEKKDSQGICFLGQVTLADFLKEYIFAKPGLVMTSAGERVGEHEGAELYTIGQRHIGVANRGLTRTLRRPARKDQNTKPYYVLEKNIKNNTLVVGEENDPALSRKKVLLAGVNFINPKHSDILQNVGMSVYARVRYQQPLVKATLKLTNSRTHELIFDVPIKSVAAGQSAVFYDRRNLPAGRQVLGGGVLTD